MTYPSSCLGSVIISEFLFLNLHAGTDGRPPSSLTREEKLSPLFLDPERGNRLPTQLDAPTCFARTGSEDDLSLLILIHIRALLYHGNFG